MTAGLVTSGATWPEPGPLQLEVLAEADGGGVQQFRKGGPFEIELVGPIAVDDPRLPKSARLIIPIAFQRRSTAERAAKVLADAITRVNDLVAETPPACEHRTLRLLRFSRSLEQEVVCDECGAAADVSFPPVESDRPVEADAVSPDKGTES